MSKGLREPRASGARLRSQRSRAQTRPSSESNSRFVRAFADALRDILKDERRRAA